MDREPIGLAQLDSDGAGTPFRASRMRRFEITDADEFGELAERFSDWTIELTHLQSGAFTGSMQLIPLGPVLITCSSYSKAMMEHCAPPEHCITLARPGRGSVGLNYHGHGVEDGQVFVAGPGAEGEVVYQGEHHSVTFSMRRDLLEQAADWLSHSASLASVRGAHLHGPGEHWVSGFLEAVRWIVDAVERYPEATARPEVRGSLLDSLLARVNVLGAADAPIHEDRHMRIHRRLAVERARDYIAQHLTDRIRLSDLSRHAHIQARSLEYGFREVIGMSPMAYVRATRLHRARHLLRTTVVRTRSISEIALDCGFWHLSQFSMDYKLLFGESPSITFRRTEAELPRSERRRQVSMQPPDRTGNTVTRSVRLGVASKNRRSEPWDRRPETRAGCRLLDASAFDRDE